MWKNRKLNQKTSDYEEHGIPQASTTHISKNFKYIFYQIALQKVCIFGKEYFWKSAFFRMGTRRNHPQLSQILVSLSPMQRENESCCFCCWWGHKKVISMKSSKLLRGEGSEAKAWGDMEIVVVRAARKIQMKRALQDSPAGRNPSAVLLSISITLPICSHYLVNPHLVLSCEKSQCHHPVCTRKKETKRSKLWNSPLGKELRGKDKVWN